jgi:hypothetical protein
MRPYHKLPLFTLLCALSACNEQAPVLSGRADFVTSTLENSPKDKPDCMIAHSDTRRYLPQTDAPSFDAILPAQENECGFYNWAQQTFLHVTQPSSTQAPAFIDYPDFGSTFHLKSTEIQGAPRLVLNGGFNQAGEFGGVLVDQNHSPIFYSIHINQAFANFVQQEGINQLNRLLALPEEGGISASTQFPPGAVELKAAWKIVDPGEDSRDYFTLPTRVPLLKNNDGKVVPSGEYRNATVALLGLHVVGSVQDHPEFIWASFEHVNSEGEPNLVPSALHNPISGQIQNLTNKGSNYPLFAQAQGANHYSPQAIDEASQKFSHSTSIFRVFPASLSKQSEEDEEVASLNASMTALFTRSDPNAQDPRRHYRMIGAVWLDDPGADRPEGVFKADRFFENTEGHTILAGEDAMSNMAMESFTQISHPHCFSCHNTQSKYIGHQKTLPPRRINISNVVTFFAERALAQDAD